MKRFKAEKRGEKGKDGGGASWDWVVWVWGLRRYD